MGSAAGAIRAAAARVGVSEADYRAHIAAGQKWCRIHRAWHDRSDFGADRSRADGLASRCRSSFVREAPGPTIPERRRARARGEAWCRRCEAWCPADDIRQGACRVHRNEAYREAYRAAGGAYKRGAASARRRGVGRVPGDVRAHLLSDATGGLCAYGCGRAAVGLDHVIPVARGGETVRGNMVPACATCNSRKRDGDPLPWLGRLTDDAVDLICPTLLDDGPVLALLIG